MTDRMCSSYTFGVEALDSRQLPSFSSNRVTATRIFRVHPEYSEEFALRQIGKYYGNGLFTVPQLPARYPTDLDGGFAPPYRQLALVATSFSIRPESSGRFNSFYMTPEGGETFISCIKDPESPLQMEKDYSFVFDYDPERMLPPTIPAVEKCQTFHHVEIGYESVPWHCQGPPVSSPREATVSILEETAISIERVAGYELYTLPNRNLYWKDISVGDKNLKGDSYATILIPKQDITVTWYNVPVARLKEIEYHLAGFRKCVNSTDFTVFSECLCLADEEAGCNSGAGGQETSGFERDTVLFVDWSEDKQARTTAFRRMNTTNLVLEFKQKRIFTDSDPKYVGWNHLFSDRLSDNISFSPWQEVAVKNGVGSEPLYERKDLNSIFMGA